MTACILLRVPSQILLLQINGKITEDGVFLEQLETNPAKYLPDVTSESLGGEVINVSCTNQCLISEITLFKCGLCTLDAAPRPRQTKMCFYSHTPASKCKSVWFETQTSFQVDS